MSEVVSRGNQMVGGLRNRWWRSRAVQFRGTDADADRGPIRGEVVFLPVSVTFFPRRIPTQPDVRHPSRRPSNANTMRATLISRAHTTALRSSRNGLYAPRLSQRHASVCSTLFKPIRPARIYAPNSVQQWQSRRNQSAQAAAMYAK